MSLAESQPGTKRYTVLNTHDDIRGQIAHSKESPQLPIVLYLRSVIGNRRTLYLFDVKLVEDSVEDQLFGTSEGEEDVTVYIPRNGDPALAVLPN